MLEEYKGKFVRITYERDGRKHGVKGVLGKVDGNNICIGGIKILNLVDYTIEEIKEEK